MTCQYLIGMCAKTRLPCPHCTVDGKCDEAACTNAVVPTWNELLDIYEVAKKPRAARLANIRTYVKSFVTTLGFDMDSKVAVTDEQIDETYKKLLETCSPYTVESISGALKACTAKGNRDVKLEYRRRSKQIPDFDLPKVSKPAPNVVQLTPEQRRMLRDEMTLRRTSGKPGDVLKFLWLWLEYEFGMRPIDVAHLTWGAFKVHSDGSMWLDYTPSKTEDKCKGRRSGCKLTEEQIEIVNKFRRGPNDPIFPVDVNKIPKSGCVKVKHGEYSGDHENLNNYAIGFMRSIGVKDPKPQYAIRKDCSQRTIKEKGLLHESQMMGHTPKIATTCYAELSKLDLKEGL